MWRPLITDPQQQQRLRGVVREIAEAVEAAPIKHHDVGTHCDLAILHAFVALDDECAEHVAAAIDAQAERRPSRLGLHDGLAGVGWTIAHLASDENAEAICDSIDAALLLALDGEWQGDYDLISGLVGFGVYALERGDRGRALAARVLECLRKSAEPRGAGLAWRTSPRLLPAHQRASAPNGYWNLGIAHGIPGVVGFCARSCAARIEASLASELMNGAIRYLLDAEVADDNGRFATWHAVDGERFGDPTRLAWCYGDLGVAVALQAAALVEPQWAQDALSLARACAIRPRAASLRDAAVCHGAAGITHALNRMYQATGDEMLGAAAHRWLGVTLDIRNEHAYAGFPAFNAVTRGWSEDSTLVSGATGVALVLHSLVSETEPTWDRALLLDLEPRT